MRISPFHPSPPVVPCVPSLPRENRCMYTKLYATQLSCFHASLYLQSSVSLTTHGASFSRWSHVPSDTRLATRTRWPLYRYSNISEQPILIVTGWYSHRFSFNARFSYSSRQSRSTLERNRYTATYVKVCFYY